MRPDNPVRKRYAGPGLDRTLCNYKPGARPQIEIPGTIVSPLSFFGFMKSVLFLLIAALTLNAADVTGKWSGTINITRDDGSSREHDAAAELTQSGDNVTGTIGPPERQVKIKTGKLMDGKLALEAEPPEGGVATFELTLKDNRLEGLMTMKQGDQTRHGKLNLTKQ